MTADELTCPKCQGAMRRYERNGIHVDQCRECRGVFLDRGELEHLIDAEATFSQAQRETPPPSPSGYPPPTPRPGYDQRHERGYDDRRYSEGGNGGRRPKRRKSFLEELFD